MRDLLLVAVGGAIGASGRYGVSLAAARLLGAGFPWGTLFVNVLGGLAMGWLAGAFAERRDLQLLLGVGVLGGFTTFSAFSIEIVRMLDRGAVAPAAAYAAASVALAVGAAFAGYAMARAFA